MKCLQDRDRSFISPPPQRNIEPLLPRLAGAPSDQTENTVTTRLRFKRYVDIHLTPLLLPVFGLLQQELFSIVRSSTCHLSSNTLTYDRKPAWNRNSIT
jgi:hypothetical protein